MSEIAQALWELFCVLALGCLVLGALLLIAYIVIGTVTLVTVIVRAELRTRQAKWEARNER